MSEPSVQQVRRAKPGQHEIRIERARSHNLQGVTCRIPLRSLTVVTGVSGSGKSTLAFDTLYAEGQRRYVSSLSTYARQFLERLPRPEVDRISHLPPAIAIEQRNSVTNARSTVGTATEILDYLRLLYARAGQTRCPGCDRAVRPGTVASVTDRILERFDGERASVGAPLDRENGPDLDRLAAEGFTRLLARDGDVVDVTELDPDERDLLSRERSLLVDRLRIDAEDGRGRVAEAVASAFAKGHGELELIVEGQGVFRFREGFACEECGRRFPTPTPALFSFNSALGACRACQGFGRIQALDYDLVVPDPTRSIEEDAIAPFATNTGRAMQADLLLACARLGIPTRVPFAELDDEQRELVLEGDGGDWYGVRGFFDWLEGRRYKVQSRVLIARYRRFDPCAACGETRLCPDALAVEVAGRSLGAVGRMTIAELHRWLQDLALEGEARERSARLLVLLRARVATVVGVGLDYVTLDRQVRTLSGGEAQRIQLAAALGGSLTAALYVLDEPSIGLHPRDMTRLLRVIERIRDQGNTVVVVEHATEIIRAADHVIDLGPGAGREGGRLVVEGTVEAVEQHASSRTGASLRREADIAGPRRERRPRRGSLRIEGACANNLRNLDVEVPLGQLVAVTGVSGAGKSTLVRSLRSDPIGGVSLRGDPAGAERILGTERIAEVVRVDQTPATRSPRSNPATISKAFEGIRKRFAATREARALGVGPGWFSFNVPGGRCDQCEGAGEVVIDMQFLDDVRVPCDRCGGLRYRSEVLDVKVDGRSIVDVLGLTLAEAMAVFADDPRVHRCLEPFARVGLGYLALGQPLSTLSGGEHQRVRLGLALGSGAADRLYVLDEPTTGLHPEDVCVLLSCLDELIDAGGSVVAVEHNLDLIREADHVIDIGPGGGPEGGRLVAEGPPEAVARSRASITGAALRGELLG